MRRASIDIGSNSVLLLVVELNDGVIRKEILNESAITSLGKDLDVTRKFHLDSMKATYEALKEYRRLLDQVHFPADKVLVTATEASRVSTNSFEFFQKIKNDLGFNIQIISSVGEAYYTALGVSSTISSTSLEKTIIMDMGGASTELIEVQLSPFEIIQSISLPMGSVRATDWRENGQLETNVSKLLEKDLSGYKTSELVCVAGSMTALATMYSGQQQYSDENVEGMKIPFKSFIDFSANLQKSTVESLRLLFPFLGKRAPMVAAGSYIAEKIGKKLEIDRIKISTRGLRYGTVMAGGIDERFIN